MALVLEVFLNTLRSESHSVLAGLSVGYTGVGSDDGPPVCDDVLAKWGLPEHCDMLAGWKSLS